MSDSAALRRPRAMRMLRALAREVRTVVTVGPSLARSMLIPARRRYRRALPVQAPSTYRIAPGGPLADLTGFTSWLGVSVDDIRSGEDSLYLAPDPWRRSSLALLAERYPEGCGLKISKNLGGVDAHYLTSRAGRYAQERFSGAHAEQLLTFAFLHLQGIAPRLYDLVELTDDESMRVAYVVQHIDGEAPDPAAFDQVIGRLKSLCDESSLQLVAGGGWHGIDFTPPDGNGNVLVSISDRTPYYVDVHNFTTLRYGHFVETVAREASAASHFGNTSVLLGGRRGAYLYQEVPGVALPAKRSPATRMLTYDALLGEAGVSVGGRVVLDIGCNLGLMGAEQLRRGAAWLHGWDRADVTAASRRVLLAIGCTRFSHSAMELSADADLAATLPGFLRTAEDDQVILHYLAIRGHVGWLPALRTLPWHFMLYEGHQGDDDLERYVAELNEVVPVQVLARGQVSDANSKRRDAAVIERVSR